jgi:hypothetical protein
VALEAEVQEVVILGQVELQEQLILEVEAVEVLLL